ncbi:hypothetical protein FJQ87_18540 (plasmid) [Shewanella sp. SNU WT4]|uniref:hypothetical protein n=1 Tax=Shewanella sp. SNU WT4 TaxID=2590015 RepID=UPI001126CDDD|nr:hypothetical protein [Shewanella sp. SNU WT4]QDF68703.1 hypothetical protein FJQ87_18540 [Shewanella sp. SNU WT4]
MNDKKHHPNQVTPLTDNALNKSLEEWLNTPDHDDGPKFELNYNGSPVFIDMFTLLQCLKIAEHAHHIPKINASWWLEIIRQYPIEVHLDGRIQTECSAIDFTTSANHPAQ